MKVRDNPLIFGDLLICYIGCKLTSPSPLTKREASMSKSKILFSNKSLIGLSSPEQTQNVDIALGSKISTLKVVLQIIWGFLGINIIFEPGRDPFDSRNKNDANKSGKNLFQLLLNYRLLDTNKDNFKQNPFWVLLLWITDQMTKSKIILIDEKRLTEIQKSSKKRLSSDKKVRIDTKSNTMRNASDVLKNYFQDQSGARIQSKNSEEKSLKLRATDSSRSNGAIPYDSDSEPEDVKSYSDHRNFAIKVRMVVKYIYFKKMNFSLSIITKNLKIIITEMIIFTYYSALIWLDNFFLPEIQIS